MTLVLKLKYIHMYVHKKQISNPAYKTHLVLSVDFYMGLDNIVLFFFCCCCFNEVTHVQGKTYEQG